MTTPLSGLGFHGFKTPTIETFARAWRRQVYHNLRMALRWREVPYMARSFLGSANAAVSVLYDVNHPGACHCAERYRMVVDICEAFRIAQEQS